MAPERGLICGSTPIDIVSGLPPTMLTEQFIHLFELKMELQDALRDAGVSFLRAVEISSRLLNMGSLAKEMNEPCQKCS